MGWRVHSEAVNQVCIFSMGLRYDRIMAVLVRMTYDVKRDDPEGKNEEDQLDPLHLMYNIFFITVEAI